MNQKYPSWLMDEIMPYICVCMCTYLTMYNYMRNMHRIHSCIDLPTTLGLGWVRTGASELVDHFRSWCNHYLRNGAKLSHGKSYLTSWAHSNFYLMKENDIKSLKFDSEFLKMFCYYVTDKTSLWIQSVECLTIDMNGIHEDGWSMKSGDEYSTKYEIIRKRHPLFRNRSGPWYPRTVVLETGTFRGLRPFNPRHMGQLKCGSNCNDEMLSSASSWDHSVDTVAGPATPCSWRHDSKLLNLAMEALWSQSVGLRLGMTFPPEFKAPSPARIGIGLMRRRFLAPGEDASQVEVSGVSAASAACTADKLFWVLEGVWTVSVSKQFPELEGPSSVRAVGVILWSFLSETVIDVWSAICFCTIGEQVAGRAVGVIRRCFNGRGQITMGELCSSFISPTGSETWESSVELGNDSWGFPSKFSGRNFAILAGTSADKYTKDMEPMP